MPIWFDTWFLIVWVKRTSSESFVKIGDVILEKMRFLSLVSCLFTKHILPCSFVTVDGTEILHTPKRRSSIARHSIPSTFFCGSAVCLLISQNVNKKNYATFKMGIFGSETIKNQLLSIKLLPKVIFRKFFTHICSYLFTFSITLKCKQMAVSL